MVLDNENIVDKNFDDLFKVNYTLYKYDYNTLVSLFLNNPIYKDVDLASFDTKSKYNKSHSDITNKISGIASSIFYGFNDNGNVFLLDGYKRLFTLLEETKDINLIIYIKVFDGPIPNSTLFKMLYTMNSWKLSDNNYSYTLRDFFDRGFRLFVYVKFNINMDFEYNRENPSFSEMLFSYFTDVRYDGGFHYKTNEFKTTISKETFIDDLYEMGEIAKLPLDEFKNRKILIEETLGFMSYLRNCGYTGKLTYQMFEDKVKEDKKFFAKLVKMYGNEATNKSILNFLFKLKPEFIQETQI